MTERNPADYAVVDVRGEHEGDRTCSFDDRWFVVSEDQEIMANCVSREVADIVAAALRANGELTAEKPK